MRVPAAATDGLTIDGRGAALEPAGVESRGRVRAVLSTSLLLVTLLRAAQSSASSPADVAAAEALFQQGRALLEAGDHAEACPKLEASHRADPATGTLIALAACHELAGRLASAWAEFTEAAGRAAREGRSDRQQLASERAAALEPRLSTLTLRVSPALAGLEGFELRRSGRTIARGAWNAPVPVDGGEYVLEAAAHGRQTWRTTLRIAPERHAAVLTVPVLAPLADASTRRTPPRTARPVEPSPRGFRALEWAGVTSAGAGVLSLGVAGYFTARMLDKRDEAEPYCSDDGACYPEGAADMNEALAHGRRATGFAIAGGALLAAGSALFVIGRSQDREPAVALGLASGELGASLRGRF